MMLNRTVNGRKALLVIILLILAFIMLSFRFCGYEATWHLWNIPTRMPPSSDLRVLPGGAESYRAGFNPIHNNPGAPFSAFRLGDLIYVGTFVLGNNWDYCLIFQLFTVPQLVEWALESPAQKPARWSLASLVIACWYLINLSVFRFLAMGDYLAYFLDQISKWALFAGLCYFFCASAPDWLKIEIRSAFRPRKRKAA